MYLGLSKSSCSSLRSQCQWLHFLFSSILVLFLIFIATPTVTKMSWKRTSSSRDWSKDLSTYGGCVYKVSCSSHYSIATNNWAAILYPMWPSVKHQLRYIRDTLFKIFYQTSSEPLSYLYIHLILIKYIKWWRQGEQTNIFMLSTSVPDPHYVRYLKVLGGEMYDYWHSLCLPETSHLQWLSTASNIVYWESELEVSINDAGRSILRPSRTVKHMFCVGHFLRQCPSGSLSPKFRLGHSMGAPWGPLQMIPVGVNHSKTVTSIHDRWCLQVPAEALGTQIRVKITLFGKISVGTCGFMSFSWPKMIPPLVRNFKCQEPAGRGEFTCEFFLQVACRYLLCTQTCAIP